jgi:Amt family ammonium transporter
MSSTKKTHHSLKLYGFSSILVIALFFPINSVSAKTDFSSINSPEIINTIEYSSPDTLMILLGFLLVFFCINGIGMMYTGLSRRKNAVSTLMMTIQALCLGAIGYWATGFAIQYGGINFTYQGVDVSHSGWSFAPKLIENWGIDKLASPLMFGGANIFGLSGFFLTGLSKSNGILVFFLLQMMLTIFAALLPIGALIERVRFIGIALVVVFISAFIYPLIGNWIWGGGWLANLGRSVGFGNGVVDFAGSGVIHVTAGMVALVGAYVLGPRIGKHHRNGDSVEIPGHSIILAISGTLLLFLGSIGMVIGLSAGITNHWQNIAIPGTINIFFGGVSGSLSAMIIASFSSRVNKPVPLAAINGIRAGIVAVAAPCVFTGIKESIIIGLIAGILVSYTPLLLDRLHIDDPVGAIPVHLVNGFWGLVAAGIFANANPETVGWNGVATPVTGLIYGNASQFFGQCVAAFSLLITTGIFSFLYFKVLSALGMLRVPADVELEGLDNPILGVMGYPRDWEPSPTSLQGLPGYTGNKTTEPVAAE